MPALGALRDIGTAVPPRKPLQLMPDLHLAGLQVQVLPPQPERLALAQAACQAHRPPSGVAPLRNGREHGTGLNGAQWRLVRLLKPGCLDQPAGVAGDVAPLDLDLVGA